MTDLFDSTSSDSSSPGDDSKVINQLVWFVHEVKTDCNRRSIRVPSLDQASRFAYQVQARSRILGLGDIPVLDGDEALLEKLNETGFCDDKRIIAEFVRLILDARDECEVALITIPLLNRASNFAGQVNQDLKVGQ